MEYFGIFSRPLRPQNTPFPFPGRPPGKPKFGQKFATFLLAQLLFFWLGFPSGPFPPFWAFFQSRPTGKGPRKTENDPNRTPPLFSPPRGPLKPTATLRAAPRPCSPCCAPAPVSRLTPPSPLHNPPYPKPRVTTDGPSSTLTNPNRPKHLKTPKNRRKFHESVKIKNLVKILKIKKSCVISETPRYLPTASHPKPQRLPKALLPVSMQRNYRNAAHPYNKPETADTNNFANFQAKSAYPEQQHRYGEHFGWQNQPSTSAQE